MKEMYICGYLTIAMMTFKPIRRQIIFSFLQQRVNDYDKCVNLVCQNVFVTDYYIEACQNQTLNKP
jgi:hypothetical protein